MPTFTENYYYHLGSATLKPELTRQFSAGLTMQAAPSRKWWPLVAFTADGYYNRVADRIVSVPYNLFVWRTVNMGDVHTAGLDVTLQSTWQPVPRHTFFAGCQLHPSAQHRPHVGQTLHLAQTTGLHPGAQRGRPRSPGRVRGWLWWAVCRTLHYAGVTMSI